MRKLLFIAIFLTACSNPQPGPDKTIGGALLGAGWGAGAGAVIGHQVSYAGEGAAIGAGFGAVSGALVGLGNDLNEDTLIEQEKVLAALKLQNEANSRQLKNLQDTLDQPGSAKALAGVHQVYFDVDVTSLRAGATAELEVIAEQIKANPYASKVHIVGHSDDSGTPEYNARLAEARARSVSAFLASRGVPMSQMKISSHGSERPVANNSSDFGRQLNRRVDVYVE